MSKFGRLLIVLMGLLIVVAGAFGTVKASNEYCYRFSETENVCGSEITVEIADESVLSYKIPEKANVIVFKALKKGETAVKINVSFLQSSSNETKEIFAEEYFHSNSLKMLFFGNGYLSFDGIESIWVCALLLLLYLTLIKAARSKKSIRNRLYDQKNIFSIASVIFRLFFIAFMVGSVVLNHHFNTKPLDLNGITENILDFGTEFCFMLLPFSVSAVLYVIISGIALTAKEKDSAKKSLSVFFVSLIITCISFAVVLFIFSEGSESIGRYTYSDILFIERFSAYCVAYLVCVFCSFAVCSVCAARKKVVHNKDFIIILGCKINSDGTVSDRLKERVDAAVEFKKAQFRLRGKNAKLVLSGGKGRDEPISEAQAMKNYLLSLGISEKDMAVEDKSTSTFENMEFSRSIIKNGASHKTAFSTSDYHVFRSGLAAKKARLDADGIRSKSKWYFIPYAFMREFAGVVLLGIKKHIFRILILFALTAALTALNNIL